MPFRPIGQKVKPLPLPSVVISCYCKSHQFSSPSNSNADKGSFKFQLSRRPSYYLLKKIIQETLVINTLFADLHALY